MAHIRKSCSQFIYIFPYKRIRGKHAYLVFNQHKISCFKLRVYSAAGVGEKQYFCAHELHQSGGKDYICNRISFIIVDSSFHAHNRNITHITEYEFSCMTGNGGDRKAFNVVVINFSNNFYIIGVVTQT